MPLLPTLPLAMKRFTSRSGLSIEVDEMTESCSVQLLVDGNRVCFVGFGVGGVRGVTAGVGVAAAAAAGVTIGDNDGGKCDCVSCCCCCCTSTGGEGVFVATVWYLSVVSNEDNAGAELLVTASGEGEMDEDDDIRWLVDDTEDGDDFALAGSSTVTTRNRELAAKKSVGELPVDEGDGEVDLLLLRLVRLPPPPPPEDSPTRVTWKRLREGLGTGDAMGDGIGLGSGERKRPPGFLLGSSR